MARPKEMANAAKEEQMTATGFYLHCTGQVEQCEVRGNAKQKQKLRCLMAYLSNCPSRCWSVTVSLSSGRRCASFFSFFLPLSRRCPRATICIVNTRMNIHQTGGSCRCVVPCSSVEINGRGSGNDIRHTLAQGLHPG